MPGFLDVVHLIAEHAHTLDGTFVVEIRQAIDEEVAYDLTHLQRSLLKNGIALSSIDHTDEVCNSILGVQFGESMLGLPEQSVNVKSRDCFGLGLGALGTGFRGHCYMLTSHTEEGVQNEEPEAYLS